MGWKNFLWEIWNKVWNYRLWLTKEMAMKFVFVCNMTCFIVYPLIALVSYFSGQHKWLWIPIVLVMLFYALVDLGLMWLVGRWNYHAFMIVHFLFMALANGLLVNYQSLYDFCSVHPCRNGWNRGANIFQIIACWTVLGSEGMQLFMFREWRGRDITFFSDPNDYADVWYQRLIDKARYEQKMLKYTLKIPRRRDPFPVEE